jgi:GntR family transcriptional regulator
MADPMYRQIAEDLRYRIESGELSPGSQLMTEIELRERYNASRNTVRDAIKWLITRGLVETRPGQGTFVTERIVPFITTLTGDSESGEGETYTRGEEAARPMMPHATTPRVEIQGATEAVAAALGIKENASVVSRHQQRYIDNSPWSLQTSFYPMSLVERGATRLIQATEIEEGTLSYLHEALGIRHTGWHDVITVRAADEAETRFFKLPEDGRVPVIEIVRTIYDDEGTQVRHTATVYPADRNQFVINGGDVPPHRVSVAPKPATHIAP